MQVSSKALLRKEALARRAAVPVSLRDDFASELARDVPGLICQLGAYRTIASFTSIRDEVDVGPLNRALIEAGFAVGLPVATPGQSLVFRQWRPQTAMVSGFMNIPEPALSAPALIPDLVLMPLAAFDARGGRIGYGGGFYDRTLAALPGVATLGLAFSCQEVALVPQESHDVPLAFVLTERGLRKFRPD